MPQLTKKRKVAAGKIDAIKAYDLQEATALVKETSTTKFDATADIAVRPGVDPKKSTEMAPGTASLPHVTGPTVRVPVPADAPECVDEGAAAVAKAALVAHVAKVSKE